MTSTMTESQALKRIDKELATAELARASGNEGMARVCARRAAGIAISYWLKRHPHRGWGVDAMSQLRRLQVETTINQTVRNAAERLTTRITAQFASAFSTDPIEDSRIIINHLLQQD